MRHLFWISGFMLFVVAVGCREADESSAPATAPSGETETRKPPQFHQNTAGDKMDIDRMMAEALRRGELDLPPGHPPVGTTMPADSPPMGAMPPDHPPIGTMPSAAGNTLPAGHPPIGQQTGPMAFTGDLAAPKKMLDLKPPGSWTPRPARDMTVAVYGIPKPPDAPADAEVTVSHYPGMKNIPLEKQVERWALQVTQPDGQPGQPKRSQLDNTAHPTTLVDLTGTYRTGSMMMGGGTAKPNHRMMMAVVETEQGPWFIRLLGPQETVSAREKEFLEFVREAK